MIRLTEKVCYSVSWRFMLLLKRMDTRTQYAQCTFSPWFDPWRDSHSPVFLFFFLSGKLHACCTCPVAMNFVSGNMGSISVRHLKQLKAKRRSTPIVLRNTDNIKKLVIQRFEISMIMHFGPTKYATYNIINYHFRQQPIIESSERLCPFKQSPNISIRRSLQLPYHISFVWCDQCHVSLSRHLTDELLAQVS